MARIGYAIVVVILVSGFFSFWGIVTLAKNRPFSVDFAPIVEGPK
jgi:hypothetical protein